MFLCNQCFWFDDMDGEYLNACYESSDDGESYLFCVFTV